MRNLKKIIKEEIDSFDWVKETNPSEAEIWLYDNFSDLTPVPKDDKVFYVDNDRKPIFYYYQDEKNGDCWFKYNDFWTVFRDQYGMEYSEIQELLKRWLDVTYNLGGLTPDGIIFTKHWSWTLPII